MSGERQRIIAKSNHLIEASYKLKLNEQRLVLAAISKIDSRKPMPKHGIKITAVEFAETYKDVIDPKYAYEALRDAARDLYERSITKIEGKVRTDTRWLSEKKEYELHDGYVLLYFSERLAPYLADLNEKFTKITMKQVAGLRSAYSIRLLEMLMRFKQSGVLKVSVEDFRDRIGAPEKYKWNDIKKRIIEPAIVELKLRGQLEVEFLPIKKGRSVVKLEFYFRKTEQMAMNV